MRVLSFRVHHSPASHWRITSYMEHEKGSARKPNPSHEGAMSIGEPRVVLLMGANGAGKSHWTRTHRDELPEHFFNREATTDRLGLCPDATAARSRCLAAEVSFGIETTVTRLWRLGLLREAATRGYVLEAIFVGTADPKINVRRVRRRTERNEGHPVPGQTIRRRWRRVQENLIAQRAAFRSIRIIDSTNDPAVEAARINEDGTTTMVVREPDGWIVGLIAGLQRSGERRRMEARDEDGGIEDLRRTRLGRSRP